MPTPSDFQVGIMDISKAERNAIGYMIIERIATKRKLSISYAYLTSQQMTQVLQAVSGTSYPVNYLDPQTGSFRTATFYCGDRNMGMISYVNGVPYYKDIKFDLIER
jgi:hypothetical protein